MAWSVPNAAAAPMAAETAVDTIDASFTWAPQKNEYQSRALQDGLRVYLNGNSTVRPQ